MNVAWTGTLALATLLIAAGCSDSPEFEYTGEDMQRAIVGTWTGHATPSTASGDQLPSKLEIAYSSPGSRPSCENRVLGLQPECIDSSAIGVTGTFTTDGLGFSSVPFTGQYTIMSLRMMPGDLSLSSADASTMTGRMKDDGSLELALTSHVAGREGSYSLVLSRAAGR